MADFDLNQRILYPVPRDAVVRRGLVYKRDNGAEVLLDVYAPARPRAARSPAVFFIHGGPIPAQMPQPREWGLFISYGELAAASGLVGVVCNHRLHAPGDYSRAESDIQAAVDYVRANSDELEIDPDRIGLWAFSGGGPLLSWALRDRPAHVRCLLAFYAILDLRHMVPPNAGPAVTAGAERFSPAAHVRERSAGLPMFLARAGFDSAMINDAMNVFLREAVAGNAALDFFNHPQGRHTFDGLDDNDRTREIITRAVAFAQTHLLPAGEEKRGSSAC